MNVGFLKNVSWLVFGKVFQMILGFMVGILSARYLGPSNYGVLSYTASFLAFFSAISSLSLGDVIVKELVSDNANEGVYLGTGIVLRLISSSLSIICIVVMVITLNVNDKTILVIAILQSLSLFFSSFDLITYSYQAKLKSKIPVIITSIAYMFMTGYKVYILATEKSIYWFAFSGTLEVILVSILLLGCYHKGKHQNLKFSWKTGKMLLSISYNFIISALMISIYGQIDKIMLGQMVGQASVGYYSIASNLCTMWVFVLTAIIQSANPLIVEAKKTSKYIYEKRLRQLYAGVMWISFFVSLILSIFASPIIIILYGEAFSGSIDILRVITWCVAFSYLGVSRGIWLILENKQKYIKYLSFYGVIFNFGLNYLLIPLFSTVGAALATLITQILVSIIIPLFIKELRQNSLIILDALLLKDVIQKDTIMKYIGILKNKIKI